MARGLGLPAPQGMPIGHVGFRASTFFLRFPPSRPSHPGCHSAVRRETAFPVSPLTGSPASATRHPSACPLFPWVEPKTTMHSKSLLRVALLGACLAGQFLAGQCLAAQCLAAQCLAAQCLARSSLAQSDQSPAHLPRSGPAVSLEHGPRAGLQRTEDGFLASGQGAYRAELTPEGMRLVPVLGLRAPVNQPLDFRLLGVGRRDVEILPVFAAPPEKGGEFRVTWDRGPCVEQLDVLPGGVRQSYLFEELPAGQGDLGARQRLSSSMGDPELRGGALVFSARDPEGALIREVTISTVVGIDAQGRRMAGHLAWEDGVLEYRLPADYVAEAALPLLLDLLGKIWRRNAA